MSDDFIQLAVVYRDLPDLIELSISVRFRGWAAGSQVYASPTYLQAQAQDLEQWAAAPSGRIRVDQGADTGIGWLVLDFYTINTAGHARCAVTLATGGHGCATRPEETWRPNIELATELGLIERFARDCTALATTASGEARLDCLAV